jgi:hypothetical protein
MPLEPENLRPIIAELGAAKQRDARLLEKMETLEQLLERRRPPRLDRIKPFGRENKISDRQIYRMADEGRVKLIRIGGIVFVDVDSWDEEIERARAAQEATQNAGKSGQPPPTTMRSLWLENVQGEVTTNATDRVADTARVMTINKATGIGRLEGDPEPGRGRPRMYPSDDKAVTAPPRRGQGRPRSYPTGPPS